MSPRERVLRALQCQAEFEVAAGSGELAQAVQRCQEVQRHAAHAAAQRQAVVQEMRRQQSGRSINPALAGSLQQAYRATALHERGVLQQLQQVQQEEEAQREALARLRHRQRLMERAADAQAAAGRHHAQLRESDRLDELWLARRARRST
jgi:hypothetical protein